MRIGFDAKRAFNNLTGLGNYSRNIIKQLSEMYPANNYILYNTGKNTKINDFPPEKCIVVQPDKFLFRNVPSLWRSFALPGILQRERIEIFHGLSNELPFGVANIGIKKVVTIHDLIFLRYPKIYRFADREIYKRKFRYSCRVADIVIAISEQTKRDIQYYFGIDSNKIEVIYQDCSPLFYKKLSADTLKIAREKYSLPDEYILYVGTIEERKNLLNILKAIHSFRINLPLVIVGGTTDYMKKIREFISENKLSDIYFLNTVPQHDLPAIYANSLLFIYPSVFEGFGIPVLEALNSGTPVITSRGSCLEETGGEKSIYVDPYNVEEIGSSILKVLNDSELRNNMINEGKKHALSFRSEITTKQLFNLYRKLL